MKIINYSVSYHWSDNTMERVFKNEDSRECGDLYLPDYLVKALEKYSKELEKLAIEAGFKYSKEAL